jgi:Cyclic nucleotide-binding domain/Major Facilitator Superfamily
MSAGTHLARSVRAFRAVFANRNLRHVQLAYIGFSSAEWATWIAMLVFAYESGGPTGAGLVAMIQLAPSAAIAPFAALLGDRFRPERVLLAAYVTQALTMGLAGAALLASATVALVYALAALTAASITLTRPLQAALFPQVVKSPDELTAVNAAAGTIEAASVLIGPSITGVLLAIADPGTVFVAMAGVLVCGAALVSRVRGSPPDAPPGAGSLGRTLRVALEGFHIVAAERHPRLLVTLLAAQSVAWGALDVLLVILALDLLGVGRPGVGFLNAAVGAGGVVGAAGALTFVGRRRLGLWVGVGVVGWSVCLMAVGLTSRALIAAVVLACAGAARTIMDVCGRILLQRVVPYGVLTRVFGVLEGLHVAALGVGSILAAALVAVVATRLTFIVIGAVLASFALLSWRRLADVDAAAVIPGAELDLLRGVPFLSVLPPVTLELLAGAAVPMAAGPGRVIIREGEPADRFYVIAHGEVIVSINGQKIASEKAGNHFGEIGLLERIPRTATVTARTSVDLWALERDSFIAAVSGHPASKERARGVSQERLRRGPR